MVAPSHAPRRLARLALGLVLLAASACGGDESPSDDAGAITRVGITASDGSAASLADFAGTPVVVNLWATWCTPCVKEMPAFEQVAGAIGDGVVIIGVNVGDSPEAATDFAADLGVTYPQYTDPDGVLETALAVTGLPATAFVAADGTVLEVHQGAYTAEELTAAIASHFPDGGSQP